MRPLYGTANSTASSVAAQLYSTDTNTRIFEISVKARGGNVGMVYFGTDTSVGVGSGYELDSAKELKLPFISLSAYDVPATMKAHTFYMSAGDTTDKLDWFMLLET